jgi:surface polysaccharide O-acyltransferase-like enzyme
VVTLGRDLLTGAARYHLYFLLVSMQIYLCFPIIRRLIRATRDHHGKLLVAAVVYQLTFTLAAHAGRPAGGVLGAWLGGPDALLPSYVLYVIAGGVAAWHLDALERAVRVHSRAVLAAGGASVVVGVVVYLVQVAAGRSPTDASAVFQPIVVVESVGVAAAFLALGVMWADRGTPARRIVTAASDASLGVYLAHPLVIQVLLTLGVSTGLDAALGGAPEALALAVALLVISPAVYVSAALVTAAARRTPLSLALTGRPWNRTGAHDIVVRTTAPAASRAA